MSVLFYKRETGNVRRKT